MAIASALPSAFLYTRPSPGLAAIVDLTTASVPVPSRLPVVRVVLPHPKILWPLEPPNVCCVRLIVLSLLAASLMKVTSLWTSATSRMKALAAAAVARPLFMFSYPMVRSPRQACCSASSRYLWC